MALVLGCQDVGTGPDGLEPQFSHSPGSCKGHHRHDEGCDEIRGRPEYTVEVTGDFKGSGPTTPVRGGEIIANDFDADLNFFVNQVMCGGGGDDLPKTLIRGTLTILAGDDHLHFGFSFMHNEAKHHLGFLETTKPAIWPPTDGNAAMLGEMNGSWGLSSQGKNHQDGCTGQGNNMTWEAEVTFVK